VHCTVDETGSDGARFRSGTTIHNNIFSNINGHCMRLDGGGGVTASHNLVYNLAGSRSHGFNSLEFEFDPEYTDPDNGDYTLGEGSGAVDIGMDASSFTLVDLEGTTRPLDAGWDLGAYEGEGRPVYFVSTYGSDGNDGLTPQTPFRTVQHAITLCDEPSSTVYVAPGVYGETLEVGLGAGASAVGGTDELPSRVVGDTLGTHTNESPGPVVIDGSGTRTHGVHISGAGNWAFESLTIRDQTQYAVQTLNAGVRLIGCTIDVPPLYGLYTLAADRVLVEDCTFERDADARHVAWIQPASAAQAPDVTITRTDATRKDDLYGATNLSDGFGSGFGTVGYGLVVIGAQYPLGRVEITNIQISDALLGIYTTLRGAGAEAVIANNTVTESYYSIYAYATSGARGAAVHNNIMASCYMGLMIQGDPDPSVLANLEHDIGRDMTAYGRPFGPGIMTGDPMFLDARSGDFALIEGSPAIDTGTSASAPALDIGSRSRPSDGDGDGVARRDLGAYELVAPRRRMRVVRWREISGHREMPDP